MNCQLHRALTLAAMIAAATIAMSAAQESETAPSAAAVGSGTIYPTAIFPFQERGSGVKGHGDKVSDILFAQLVADPNLMLVDRADMDKQLAEAELNLSGMVSPGQAIQVGYLTGAKILLTGSVMEIGNKLYIVAKIIGTETTRVLGESVKGKSTDDLDELVEELAEKVAARIAAQAEQLVAKPVRQEDLVAELRKKLGDAERPKVYIRITERHIGQATIDPAAETEVTLFCSETGFEVIDPEVGRKSKADIIIQGEGFSEFALRRGNLVSVKARLEVKAIDRATDRIIATDRQTAVRVDLTEQIAGKVALQEAARQIAIRLLPKLVK